MADNVVGSVKLEISSPGAEKATDAVGRFIGAAEQAGIVEDKVTKIHERNERALIAVARQFDTNFRKLDNIARATEKLRRAEEAGLAGTREHIAARSALAKAINDNAVAFSKLETSMQKASSIASGMSLFGGMTDKTGITSKLTNFLKVEKETLLKEAEKTGRELNARLIAGMSSTGGMTDSTGITSKLSNFLVVQKEALLKEAEKTGRELNARLVAGMSSAGGMTDPTGITSKLSNFLVVQKEALLKEAEKTGRELNARLIAGMSSAGGMTDSTGITSKLSNFLVVQKEALLKEAEKTGRELNARLIAGMSSAGGMTDSTGITSKLTSFLKVEKETLLKEAEKTGRELNARLIAGMSSAGGMTDPTNMTRRMSASVAQTEQAKKMGRNTWANISAQLQDIFVMTASGASLITTTVQQGPQLLDAMANSSVGLKGALKELGSVALSVATHPLTLVTAAFGTAIAATVAWNNQVAALTVSLNGLGRQSGMTASHVNRVAEAAAGRSGVSNREARGLAGQLLTAGVSGGSIGGAIGLSGQFSRGFGLSLEDAGKELASALADPARGADELAKKYGLVTFAEREHIKQVAALGDKSGATAKLLEALTANLSKTQDATSAWGRVLDRIGNRMSNKFDKLGQELEIAIDGRKSFKEVFDPLRRASDAAKQFAADREAERNKELNALREDAAFAADAIRARTFAEREAVAAQRAYTETFRQTYDAVKAGIVAEAERAKLLAESARKVEDLTRTSADQARLSRMTPFERRMAEIDISERDFRRENIPNAATPMASAFNTAASAARNVAEAFNGVVASVNRQPAMAGIGVRAGSDPRGMSAFIRAEASRLGINPDIALRVARSEGLGGFTGDAGSSFGAFQLHRGGIAPGGNRVSGLGDDFLRDTGLDPSNPANERQTITYALQKARQLGWAPFHGAARAGVGNWEGIGSGANDNLSVQTSRAFDEQRGAARFEATDKVLQDANRGINEQRAALEAQTVAFGRSTEAIARASKEQELINQFEAQGVKITDELRAGIEATAFNYGKLAEESESAADAQRHLLEIMDTVRGSASEALGGMASDLAHGRRAADALSDALSRIGDRLISLAANRAIEGIFGSVGRSSGGIFGAISGLFSSHAAGGFVGASSAPKTRAPISAFIGAPHFANGGAVPIIAHAGELILNAAQQHNVAAAVARGQNDNRAAPVTVNLIGAPPGTKVQEQRDSSGGRRIDVVMDERIAAGIGSPQGQEALMAANGTQRRVARR
jgi:hypothetical protein